MDCVNTAGKTECRPDQLAHRLPAFYMITMSTFGRKPLFATCENNRAHNMRGLVRSARPEAARHP